jgi:hypothetical protein
VVGWLHRNRLPLALAAGLVVVTSLPYLIGYLDQPRGRVFIGFLIEADDATTYIAKMREGWEGSWAWTNRYTTEGGPGAYLFLFWLALGHLAHLVQLPLMATFQVLRVAGAFALLVAAWAAIRHFLQDEAARRFALVFFAIGMGAGFVAALATNRLDDALDLRMPELSAFASILAVPHFVWAMTFQLAGIVLTLRAVARGSLALGALAGLAWAADASIHPHLPVLMGAATAVALVVRRPPPRGLAAAGLAFAVPAPYVAYAWWASHTVPEVVRWSAQWTDGVAPDARLLAVALAPQLLLTALAVPSMLRRRSRDDVFLLTWLVLLAVILWAPTPAASLRRRFLDGVSLPLAVMAARGLYEVVLRRLPQVSWNPPREALMDWRLRAIDGFQLSWNPPREALMDWRLRAIGGFQLRLRRLLPFAWVSLSTVTGCILLLAPSVYSVQPNYSLSRAEFDGLNWLARQPDGVVLASQRIGMLVPASTSDTTYVGQYPETYDGPAKALRADRILSGEGDVAAFSAANHVRYVFWAGEEGGPPPALGPPAFAEPGVRIYRLY